jgi:hypothetical protein
MGIRDKTEEEGGSVFSEDVLKIEICGPHEDYLTVIDVPGIFRSPTEGQTTKADMDMVRRLVTGYIKNDRTIILAVLPANVDIATQEILSLAQDHDKSGERTLAVLTKPDLVMEKTAKQAVCDLVLGKKNTLTLGYFVVRNRGADDHGSEAVDASGEFFDQAPWNTLPPDRVGAQALKSRLGELLHQITKREFPKMRKDIGDDLQRAKDRLHGLGLSRQNEREQRSYLSNIASRFQDLVSAALNAQYQRHPIFEKKPELALITLILGESDSFNRNFEKYAPLWRFDDVLDAEDDDQKAPNSSFERHELDPESFPDLDGLILGEEIPSDAQSGIMAWIKEVYGRSRGVEMGTFGGGILSHTFKSQSSRWASMTQAYISKVIMLIHQFITMILEELCQDAVAREQLWSVIQPEIRSRYAFAMKNAEFLVSLERDMRAYTLNHYFNDNLQKVRTARMTRRLKGISRPELQLNNYGEYSSDGPLSVRIDDIKSIVNSRGNDEHIHEEIHDILKSYYKVARKRFIDNVYMQAVDHLLLTGPNSPLAVFTQDWVINLDAEQLEDIAAESTPTKARREQLTKKIEDLEAAVQILRH